MPVSKNRKLYFTEKQLAIAKEASALQYAQAAGYPLKREGNCFRMQEHGSMVFTIDGRWHWNSRNLHGKAMQFIEHYEGRTRVEAVLILNGELDRSTLAPVPTGSRVAAAAAPTPDERTPFVLPPRAENSRRLFGYLCTTRKLDPDIVRDLLREGSLYQSSRELANQTAGAVSRFYNAVFVGFDSGGRPRSAFQRGLSTTAKKAFKREVIGSEKKYAFAMPCYKSTATVAVFEGAIDAISHASIETRCGEDYKRIARIALGGIFASPLIHFLKEHPTIQNIVLCFDADETGRNATVQLGARLKEHYRVSTEVPSCGKDWNDMLLSFSRLQANHGREEESPSGHDAQDELEP